MNFIAYGLLLVSILSAVVAQLLLKRGMSRHPGFHARDILALVRNSNILGGFFFYGFSMLAYFKVLETVPLSFAFPTISLGYGLVVILSSALFKEPVSGTRWLAVGVICVGVILVGLA